MYRPRQVTNYYSGKATVQIKENKVGIKFDPVDGQSSIPPIVISRDNAPEQLSPGRWVVTMNPDRTKILRITPVNGVFRGRVEKFASREGEKPSPITRTITAKDGSTYTVRGFTTIIKITQGPYAGLTVPYYLSYNFVEDFINGKSLVGFKARGSRTVALMEFCDITGAWRKGEMKYSDNILPTLEDRILKEGVEFEFVMRDGYIISLYNIEGEERDEGEEESPFTLEEENLPWEEE